MFHMDLVYQCEGRAESRFAHFKFSSDMKIMVYYNLDGIFAATLFHSRDEQYHIILSRDFIVRQDPKIYVCKQNVLITSVLQSSEDREPTGERIETLVLPELRFGGTEYRGKPFRFEGKGYLSDNGEYTLISVLATKPNSTCCQIEVYRTLDIRHSMPMKPPLFATRNLKFASNHPHLECLDRKKFNFLKRGHGNIKPLIAIHQTNSVGSRLIFWDFDSDALIYEVDLTLNKM